MVEVPELEYQQPDFYHFSEEVIDFAKKIAVRVFDRKMKRVLDLGSGCGVFGLELTLRCSFSGELFLCENNREFAPFLKKNLARLEELCPFVRGHLLLKSWEEVRGQKFDLIVSNPPFYLEGTGRIPPNPGRRQCHFWSREQRSAWAASLATLLEDNGEGYFFSHSKSMEELVTLLEGHLLQCELIAERGKTSLVRIVR